MLFSCRQPGTISQKDLGEHVKMMHKDSDLLFSEEYKVYEVFSHSVDGFHSHFY